MILITTQLEAVYNYYADGYLLKVFFKAFNFIIIIANQNRKITRFTCELL